MPGSVSRSASHGHHSQSIPTGGLAISLVTHLSCPHALSLRLTQPAANLLPNRIGRNRPSHHQPPLMLGKPHTSIRLSSPPPPESIPKRVRGESPKLPSPFLRSFRVAGAGSPRRAAKADPPLCSPLPTPSAMPPGALASPSHAAPHRHRPASPPAGAACHGPSSAMTGLTGESVGVHRNMKRKSELNG